MSYIDSETPALVDKDEYDETRVNIVKITNAANAYIDGYLNHCNGFQKLPEATFRRKYKYATLKYFHKELNIS